MTNPIALAISTIILWSFGAFLSRLISMKSEFILLSFSYTFTFITLLLYFIIKHKGELPNKLRTLTIKDILFGPFGYFIYSVGLIQSFRAFNSASETTILNYTWPVFTVIFTESLFRTKTTEATVFHIIESIGILLGLLSVVILATEGKLANLDFLNIKGIGWGLLSGISYGLFSAYSGTVPKDRQSAFLLSSITTSLVLMVIFSFKEIELVSTFTAKDLLIVFALGSLLNGIGYITWTTANRIAREKEINISSVASMMFILPLLSLVIIAILLKETKLFEPYFITSLTLIIIGSVLCQKAPDIANRIHSIKS